MQSSNFNHTTKFSWLTMVYLSLRMLTSVTAKQLTTQSNSVSKIIEECGEKLQDTNKHVHAR